MSEFKTGLVKIGVLIGVCGLVTLGCSEKKAPSSQQTGVENEEGAQEEALTVTLAPEFPLVMLTPTEYNNTIRDLYGFPNSLDKWPAAPPVAEEISPAEAESIGIFGGQVITNPVWPQEFPEELGVHGFEGMADGQVPSAYGLEALQEAALKLAPYSLVSPLFFTCEEWETLPNDEQKACAWASVERFAQRAWRRPLNGAEEEGLTTFWNDNWSGSTPEQAVVLTVAGLLQSPSFLFRIEKLPVQPENAKHQHKVLSEAWMDFRATACSRLPSSRQEQTWKAKQG